MTTQKVLDAPKLSGNRCQCTGCNEYFNSDFAFERHRVGSHKGNRRRCLSLTEMVVKGFSRNAKGFLITESCQQRAKR